MLAAAGRHTKEHLYTHIYTDYRVMRISTKSTQSERLAGWLLRTKGDAVHQFSVLIKRFVFDVNYSV